MSLLHLLTSHYQEQIPKNRAATEKYLDPIFGIQLTVMQYD